MRTIRHGDSGPAVREICQILVAQGLLPAATACFDERVAGAVRAFQQSRGLPADGRVTEETWQALSAARWRLGARALFHAVPEPLVGEDVRALQERLLELGFDTGRTDGVYGVRTARSLAQFQREVGLVPDGSCGPRTLHALRRLGRKVVGGRPQWLRESERLHRAGPTLVGRRVVVDPGHGGTDPGVVAWEGRRRWTEAELTWDLAARLAGRLTAAGVRVHLTRGPRLATPMPDAARAALANELGADLFVSLHIEGHRNPAAGGVAIYHYGTANGVTSTVGERLAELAQREIVVRTGLRDCRTHARSWDLLRLTRMPAVQAEIGYLTSGADRARLADPRFRDTIADAVLVAIQRVHYPADADVATGSFDVRELRTLLRTTDAPPRSSDRVSGSSDDRVSGSSKRVLDLSPEKPYNGQYGPAPAGADHPPRPEGRR